MLSFLRLYGGRVLEKWSLSFKEAVSFFVSKEESPRKVSEWKSGWNEKKSERTGLKEEELSMGLSSSGESDFFSTGISGWAALKASSRKVIWWIMPRPLMRMANLLA